ncbi:MAG: hypothetical protein R3B84_14885 [Zavarzinella sp.]
MNQIRQLAESDEELAAKIDLLQGFGFSDSQDIPIQAVPVKKVGSLYRRLHSAAAVALLIAFLTSAAITSYAVFRQKPLVEDSFNDGWFDTRIWDPYLGRKGVREEQGQLRLLNRGSIVPQADIQGDFEIEFDWEWVDLSSDPLYPDALTVCLFTSGRHATLHPFQPEDGLEITFEVRRGNIAICPRIVGLSNTTSPLGSLPLAPGQNYQIRIKVVGKDISIYASGSGIDPKYRKTPVMTYQVKHEFTGKRVAIYNREYVGGSNHESRLDNLIIRSLKGN